MSDNSPMDIARENIELMLAWCARNPHGGNPPLHADELAELARVYLAVMDAPQAAFVDECGNEMPEIIIRQVEL